MRVDALHRPRTGLRPRRGLTYRIVLTGILMAFLKIATFALLFVAIIALRDARMTASHSEAVLASVNRVEKLVSDLETGARGFVLTKDQHFLRSWNTARAAFPGEEANLQRLSAGENADQAGRARQIAQAADSYLREYAVPLMTAEGQDPASARARVVSGEGERRLIPLRDQVAAFTDAQRGIAAAKERSSLGAVHQATITAAAAALGSLALIVGFLTYLTRVIVRPVRRAAVMAGEVAAGDLSVRMPETSPGEIGVLESEFNTMAGSLEAGHDELRRVAEEQGALRRVATLVAQGVSASTVFAAVAEELGRLLGADHTHLVRLEPDDTVTVVGCWSDPGVPEIAPPLGEQWPVEYGTVVASVLRIGQPTRMTDYADVTGEVGTWARSHGIRHVVGCPVSVEGRVWGAMIIFSHEAEPRLGVTEDRMLDFVKLVSTAIANAQGRSELLASRARVVAASDESRRRIERNLHDGAQQQLVSLGLRLRAVQAAVPPGQAGLRRELSSTVQSLSAILEDLHEISRGLDPSILTRNGLRPALKSLARRSTVPVDLDVHVGRRLPEQVEVAMFYTVSEALTNVAKYAHASEVDIDLGLEDAVARLSVHDDGIGGAHFGGGSGLVGLRDRVEALGGGIQVISPSGGGTSLLVEIPVRDGQDTP